MEAYIRRRRLLILGLLWIRYRRRKQEEQARREIRQSRYRVRRKFQVQYEQDEETSLNNEVQLLDSESYFNYMRMTPETFEELLHIVGPKIARMSTNWRDAIPAAARLSMTLRYLATGESLQTIAMCYKVGRSTISGIVSDVCEHLWVCLQGEDLYSPTTQRWLEAAEQFERHLNFPHCIGAVDGKHIITAPANSGSSIVLMAIASATYRFLMVDIGAHDWQSDGGVFRNSMMGQRFFNDDMNLPAPSPISPTQSEVMPFVLVANEAFQLNEFTMRPYPGRSLTQKRNIFNYRLNRARRAVENAFGILVSRWRIYEKAMNTSLQTTESTVKATICLHNFLMDKERYCEPGYADYDNNDVNIVEGAWRQEALNGGAMKDIPGGLGSNMHSRYASAVRDNFMEYFMVEGAVPWQWDVE